MGEELHPSLRHGRNRGLNGGVPEVVWFEGSVVDQLFMHPRTMLVFNTAKWWAEYRSAPINYLGIGCILGVNQLHKSTLPIIHNTVVQGQYSHHMAEPKIFLGDLNLCNTYCRKKWDWQSFVAELARITGGVKLEDGWCSQDWQTKTSGDPLGPRPDQFILTCYIFWIFVFSMILTQNTLYCVASHANTLMELSTILWHNTSAQCSGLSEWFSGSQGVARSSWWDTGTLRGQSDSDANIVIYYLIKQSTVEHCKHEMNKSTR